MEKKGKNSRKKKGDSQEKAGEEGLFHVAEEVSKAESEISEDQTADNILDLPSLKEDDDAFDFEDYYKFEDKVSELVDDVREMIKGNGEDGRPEGIPINVNLKDGARMGINLSVSDLKASIEKIPIVRTVIDNIPAIHAFLEKLPDLRVSFPATIRLGIQELPEVKVNALVSMTPLRLNFGKFRITPNIKLRFALFGFEISTIEIGGEIEARQE